MAATGREAALALAGRELGRRDLSRAALALRLERSGIDAELARATVDDLTEDGLLDDERLARRRAELLAERGLGDLAIAERLERESFSAETVEAALADLPAEGDRARRLATGAARRAPARVAASLHRRGFADDSVEAALAALDAPTGAQLRYRVSPTGQLPATARHSRDDASDSQHECIRAHEGKERGEVRP